MNSDFVFWHRPFFLLLAILPHQMARVRMSFTMHRGAAGRAGAAWGCSRCLVPSAWRGELRGMCCMAKHGMLIAAEEAPAGSVLIDQSSLRRGSIGLCCLLEQTDPQSCWAAFLLFFLPKGFIFFHVSAFHLSPWPRNDYHLNNYTSVCFYSSYLAGL